MEEPQSDVVVKQGFFVRHKILTSSIGRNIRLFLYVIGMIAISCLIVYYFFFYVNIPKKAKFVIPESLKQQLNVKR